MKGLEDINFQGKTVFVRVDFNVPQDEKGEIRDDTRIRAALPTLDFLLKQNAKLIVASHLGRPKGKIDPRMSLKPVARRLGELLGREVIMAPDVVGVEVERLKSGLRPGGLLLLENVRFKAEETANDDVFAGQLALGVDCYVNDAFGSSHRVHASVVAIVRHVKEKAAGFLMTKEVEYLSRVVHSPQRPYVAIIGGAKVSDKIPVIESLLDKADDILIGGAMAYTFFKAQGFEVGRSLVEEDKKDVALSILRKAGEKKVGFHLPVDHILTPALEKEAQTQVASAFPFPPDMMAADIGPETVKKYSAVIGRAQTVFWNGPVGVFELDKFAQGTVKIAEAVAQSKAVSVVGGGDSVAAVYKAGVGDRISHISTGGGASLEYLAEGTLPGIEALE